MDQNNKLLNAPLHDALVTLFKQVKVNAEGDEGYYEVTRSESGSGYVARYATGESYSLNCPVCGDERGRLYVSHWAFQKIMKGTARVYTDGLMHCHNERCNLNEWKGKIRAIIGELPIIKSKIRERRREDPTTDFALPPDVVPIDSVEAHVACREYLINRGFNLTELSDRWGVCAVDTLFGHPGGPRIIYPVYWNGLRVSWQARVAFDPTRDQIRSGTLKYYNPPGVKKSDYLYNRDGAMGKSVVVMVEGVTDVHVVGDCGIALFGKSPSTRQMQIIACTSMSQAAGVLMLDGDVDEDRDVQEFVDKYGGSKLFAKGLTVVRLPEDKDPGSMTTEAVWDLIAASFGG